MTEYIERVACMNAQFIGHLKEKLNNKDDVNVIEKKYLIELLKKYQLDG